MRHEPRGGAIRTMRLSTTETLEDGSTVKLTHSAPGFIVRLAHIAGRKPSEVRRDFTRFCQANSIIVKPVEHSGGTYSKRTGKPIGEPQPTAYQVMGEPAALMLLVEHHTVGEYHAAIGVRVPVIAGGNGTEKERPCKSKKRPNIYATDSKDVLEATGPLPVAGVKAKFDAYQTASGFLPVVS